MHALASSGFHNSHCQLRSWCRAPTRSCPSSSHTVKSLSEQMKPPAQHCRGTLSHNSHSPAPTGLTKSRFCHETLAPDQGSRVSKPQESHFAMNQISNDRLTLPPLYMVLAPIIGMSLSTAVQYVPVHEFSHWEKEN